MQAIFMIVMVIVGVFVFKHEEDMLVEYLEGENKLPHILKGEIEAVGVANAILNANFNSGRVMENADLIFILVEWPEVQDYMDKEWFRSEAVLYQVFGEEQVSKDSAYLIPIERVLDID